MAHKQQKPPEFFTKYLVVLPTTSVILLAIISKFISQFINSQFHATDGAFLIGCLLALSYIYSIASPRPIYLVDFACYDSPDALKVSKDEFIELAKKSGNFDGKTINYMHEVLQNSGIGDETYVPTSLWGQNITLEDGRDEAATTMFGAVDKLLAQTKTSPEAIRVLVVNCGVLNPTPSLSSMIINHYKMKHDVQSFNIGGMGCAGGIVAMDLARDAIASRAGSYALVVSTEAVTYTWHNGNDFEMVRSNCLFRMGASAVLLSSHRAACWRSKYRLKQLRRTHEGSPDSMMIKEDERGRKGLVVKDGGVFKIVRDFDHVCVGVRSKNELDKIQGDLDLSDKDMEATRKTLERYGNTSSSSLWYELAYLEQNGRVLKKDKVSQIAYGSGSMCNSVLWEAI